MDSARSKRTRLAVTAGAVALLSVNAFSVNCGFAPTDIGEETEDFVELGPQSSGLLDLTRGRIVVIETGGDPLCLKLGFVQVGDQSSANTFKLGCAIYQKAATGLSTVTDTGHCRTTVTTSASGNRQVLLECADPGAEPCLGTSLEIGRIETAADFAALVESNTEPEGLTIQDAVNPAVKASVHLDQSYCVGEFADDDEVDDAP